MFTEDDVIEALGLIEEYSHFIVPLTAYGYKHSDAHLSYHVATALAMLTQAVPDNLKLEMSAGVPNLYVCLVGDPGESRKSTSIEFGTDVLSTRVLGNDDRYSERHLPSEPGSEVALVDSLVAQKKQLLVYKDFGVFLASSGGESSTSPMARVRTKLIEAYDQGKMSNLTRGRGNKSVNDVRLSILGGSAPGFFTAHTSRIDWETGFMSRFLFINPYLKERQQEQGIKDGSMRAELALRWRYLARSKEASKRLGWEPIPLLNVPIPCGDASRVGLEQWMDPNAIGHYVQWIEDVIEPRRAKKDPLLSATVSRALTMVKKIALLVSWDIGSSWTKETWRLGYPEIAFATKVVEWGIESAERLSLFVGDSRDSREINQVLQQIPEDGTAVTKAAVLKRVGMTARRLDELIQTLVQRREVAVKPTPDLESIAMLPEAKRRMIEAGVVPRPITVGYARTMLG